MIPHELKVRLTIPSEQRMLICVDEAGQFPNVVRALCAKPPLLVPADLLPTEFRGQDETLKNYLNVADIQLNDHVRDPLRWLKAELWTEAQKLKHTDNAVQSTVLLLTTTLPFPTPSEERSWRCAGVKDKSRVIPDSWLEMAIQQRVDEYVCQGVFDEDSVSDAKVIVMAMLYEDAPGVDGVIAYGTCRRGKSCQETTKRFTATTLIKLQMKYHVEKDEHMLRTGVLNENLTEGQKASRFHNAPLTAVELDYLYQMGYTPRSQKKQKQKKSEKKVVTAKVLNRLVIYNEKQGPRAHLYRASVNKTTIAEALWPTQWDGRHRKMNEHDEIVTHGIGLRTGGDLAMESLQDVKMMP